MGKYKILLIVASIRSEGQICGILYLKGSISAMTGHRTGFAANRVMGDRGESSNPALARDARGAPGVASRRI
jgi:hypothetical protein